jgi:hypothetical protein
MSERAIEEAPMHLVEAIHRDEYDFWYADCTCGEYRTVPVPDLDLMIDELMAHAARAHLGCLADPTEPPHAQIVAGAIELAHHNGESWETTE